MEVLNEAFVSSKSNNFTPMQNVENHLEHDYQYLVKTYSDIFNQEVELPEERIFISRLLEEVFENEVIEYTFANQQQECIVQALEFSIKANYPEYCKLICTSTCRKKGLILNFFELLNQAEVNETQQEFLIELMQICASNLDFYIDVKQFLCSEQYSIALLEKSELTRDLRDQIVRGLTIESNSQLILLCSKLSLSDATLGFFSELLYELINEGDQNAVHALEQLVQRNGPANFISVESDSIFEILQVSSAELHTFPVTVEDSFAEWLTDLLSYCNISFSASFIGFEIEEKVQKIEIYADACVNMIMSNDFERRPSIQGLFEASIMNYERRYKLSVVQLLEEIFSIIETKSEQLDYCSIMLEPDAFWLDNESGNYLFEYCMSKLELCSAVDDILAILELVDKITYNEDGEMIILQITSQNVEFLLQALQSTLNYMQLTSIKYTDSNSCSSIEQILYRFFNNNESTLQYFENLEMQNLQCVHPDLLMLLNLEPQSIFQYLHCQLICSNFDDFILEVEELESSEVIELCSIIDEYKSEILSEIHKHNKLLLILVEFIDFYISNSVDKQILDFLEYCERSDKSLVVEFFENKNLTDFIFNTIYTYCSSYKLLKLMVAANPLFCYPLIKEMLFCYLFGKHIDLISLSDIGDLIVVLLNATNMNLLEFLQESLKDFRGLFEQCGFEAVLSHDSSIEVQLRQCIKQLKAMIFE